METEKPFKEGHLLFPPHGVLGQLKVSFTCRLFIRIITAERSSYFFCLARCSVKKQWNNCNSCMIFVSVCVFSRCGWKLTYSNVLAVILKTSCLGEGIYYTVRRIVSHDTVGTSTEL